MISRCTLLACLHLTLVGTSWSQVLLEQLYITRMRALEAADVDPDIVGIPDLNLHASMQVLVPRDDLDTQMIVPRFDSSASHVPDDRVHLRIDASQAEAVLQLLERLEGGAEITEADWERLYATEPYVRLKQREEAMRRTFTDADFRTFVGSDGMIGRSEELRQTLDEWLARDLEDAAERVLAYLPSDARIHAKVYPVIKPQTNSFVFDVRGDPAIFLYLDPALSAAQFENTVAHELHHIGFASVERPGGTADAGYPDAVRAAIDWMGAFGEGFAMLAAAGGPDVHPHESSPPADRTRWDRDVALFNESLRDLESFFLDVIEGRLTDDEQIRAMGFSFFGEQGPWYTVGYVMATTVEQHFGRDELIAGMTDLPRLLRAYNAAASKRNEDDPRTLARWSDRLLGHLSV